jgi:hypothetical protein
MASLIGGKKYGVTKTGHNIIPVRWEEGTRTGITRGASLFEGLLWILADVKAHNKQGKAVLNYSGGECLFCFTPTNRQDRLMGLVAK